MLCQGHTYHISSKAKTKLKLSRLSVIAFLAPPSTLQAKSLPPPSSALPVVAEAVMSNPNLYTFTHSSLHVCISADVVSEGCESGVGLGLTHHTLSDSKGKHFIPCQPACYKESLELFILSMKLNNSPYGFST